MPYILDENDTPLVDENGNKIEFNISYSETNDLYIHREGIHINDDGHLDTEDRYLIVKEAIQYNHAVCKKQLDDINNNKYSKQEINNMLQALENKITASINSLKSEISKSQNINSGNNKINNNHFDFNNNR